MVTAEEIYNYIDSFAPFNTAMDFDNAGLLVGNPKSEVKKTVTTLDVTSKVIEEAVKKGAQLIISHHPIIFNPMKALLSDNIAYSAARHNLTVISAHTNLDVARGGVNDTLAEKAGVIPDEYFDDKCALLGHLNKGLSCKEFAEYIKKQLNCNGLRYTNHIDRINTVVVSCGGGGQNIYLAKELGADAFLTGEIKHHEIIFANENNISVFDLGHYRSEDFIAEKLADILKKRFSEVEFEKSEVFTDFIEYV